MGIGADSLVTFAILAVEVVGEFAHPRRRADAVVRASVAYEAREKAMPLHMSIGMSVTVIQTEEACVRLRCGQEHVREVRGQRV